MEETIYAEYTGNEAQPDVMPLIRPGRIFGSYRIVRLLGRGGMCEVYEVEHQKLEKHFAMKLLSPSLKAKAGFIDRFEQEAKVMAHLNNPHIIMVDDFGETEDILWLRMEIAKGLTLKGMPIVSIKELAHFSGGKLGQKLLCSILEQSLRGLAYAHNTGVVHRDIKPGNILISDVRISGRKLLNLKIKIADFGLAHLLRQKQIDEQRKTGSAFETGGKTQKRILGTLEYMSPEQRNGDPVDARTDIYSLGLTAYRLLTGRRNTADLVPPSEVVPLLDKKWDYLISVTANPDREKRIPSAEKMFELVAGIRESIAHGSPPPEKRNPHKGSEAPAAAGAVRTKNGAALSGKAEKKEKISFSENDINAVLNITSEEAINLTLENGALGGFMLPEDPSNILYAKLVALKYDEMSFSIDKDLYRGKKELGIGDFLILTRTRGAEEIRFESNISMRVHWILDNEEFDHIAFGCNFTHISRNDLEKIRNLIRLSQQ